MSDIPQDPLMCEGLRSSEGSHLAINVTAHRHCLGLSSLILIKCYCSPTAKTKRKCKRRKKDCKENRGGKVRVTMCDTLFDLQYQSKLNNFTNR